MDIKSYDQGWNDMVDRAIELLKNHPKTKAETMVEIIKTEFRESC
jgi:hypothetical protein